MGQAKLPNANAWTELLDQIKRDLEPKPERRSGGGQPQWVNPNKVIFYPVQMRLKDDGPSGYSIIFERAMAEAGSVNYESVPGAPEPPRQTITLHLDESGSEPFWRSDGGITKTDVLARRLIDRLQNFRQEYNLIMLQRRE